MARADGNRFSDRQGLHMSHEAFLSAIRETPDDDAPRLICADWLEDQGQAHRAEFIHLQCRLAQMDEHDPDRLPLEQREADLQLAHGLARQARLRAAAAWEDSARSA